MNRDRTGWKGLSRVDDYMSGVRRNVQRAGALALVVTGFAGLAGCTAQVENTGYVPTELQLQDIQLGEDTRDTVAEKVGAPPLDEFRREDMWVYLASRTETLGMFAPVEVERQLVLIRFTDGGSVANIERFGLDHGQVVPISRRVTEPTVADATFLHGLLRNTSLAPDLGQNDAPN